MKFSAFKKLFSTDYPDAPKGEWLGKLVANLNLFIDQSTTAFRNNLTFEENFRCKIMTVSLKSEEEVSLGALNVSGIIPLQLEPGVMLLGFSWQPKSSGVSVKIKHDGSGSVSCKLLILQ